MGPRDPPRRKNVDSGVVAEPIQTSYSAPPFTTNRFCFEIFGHIYYVFHKVFKQASRKAFMPDFFMPSCGKTWKPEPDAARVVRRQISHDLRDFRPRDRALRAFRHAVPFLRQSRNPGEGFSPGRRCIGHSPPPDLSRLRRPFHDVRARAITGIGGLEKIRPAGAIRSRKTSALARNRLAQAARRAGSRRADG